MAKSVDDIFNLILLDELLGNSVVLAISMYYVLMVYHFTEYHYYYYEKFNLVISMYLVNKKYIVGVHLAIFMAFTWHYTF